MIELKQVTRQLPSGSKLLTILDSVDLTIAHGGFAAILGPSGSGKSTMLAIMAGLDRPTQGQVLIDGQAIESLSEDKLARLRRDKVGFVFQSFQLLSNLTARENVMLPVELQGKRGARARAGELLDMVGLAERTHHYPAQLSGGEQQRVALARAFAADPPLLLADEPTGNLDAATGAMIMASLEALRAEHGTTLVLVTHDPAVAQRASHQVHLAGGRVAHEQRSDAAAVPTGASPDPVAEDRS